MEVLQFGNLGVCVEGFTKESLYNLLALHHLTELLDKRYVRDDSKLDRSMYLQSQHLGPYTEDITINIHRHCIHYITDMDSFFLILRTGMLDVDAANSLIKELYSQGLIKPRNKL